MERLALLKSLTFGTQIAEDETNELATYFVQTDQWTRIFEGQIDIIRGEKGAGKSAIYATLLDKSGQLFDKGIIVVAAENLRGATVFKDLVAEPPTSEAEFIVLWKLYIVTIVAQQLRDFDVKDDNTAMVTRALEDAKLLEAEFSLARVLRSVHEYAKRLVRAEAVEGGLTFDPTTGIPVGVTGRIVLKEPSSDERRLGAVSVDGLFTALDATLTRNGLKVWVLFDRLDVAFIENHDLEANALRALVRAYADVRNIGNIGLKIFLREDIWNRITEAGFREASHLIRYVVLDWTPPSLLNLIMRRLLSNRTLVDEFGIDADSVLQNAGKQQEMFDRFFPRQVEEGKRKGTTFNWLISRCADATKKTAPRELVHLLNCIRDQEIKRLEQGGNAPLGDQLFDTSVFKLALPTVSDARLVQYLYAEYPKQKPFLEKLDRQKAEQTPESLSDLWALDRAAAIAKARELVDLGFFEQRGTKDEPTFWVPFLYRDALSLVQGKADNDDE
ncbi:MAG: hypothetical protein BGN85_00910 [Alphaproteobacteria bacterium 64-11]|nr:hypothetical protein [Alphaproteobacteria bacterium]OJU12385.1 MAG: hypothetical protein BGN85_00910 [Alphaproteobacteria bacterium 64-11]